MGGPGSGPRKGQGNVRKSSGIGKKTKSLTLGGSSKIFFRGQYSGRSKTNIRATKTHSNLANKLLHGKRTK